MLRVGFGSSESAIRRWKCTNQRLSCLLELVYCGPETPAPGFLVSFWSGIILSGALMQGVFNAVGIEPHRYKARGFPGDCLG